MVLAFARWRYLAPSNKKLPTAVVWGMLAFGHERGLSVVFALSALPFGGGSHAYRDATSTAMLAYQTNTAVLALCSLQIKQGQGLCW